MTRKKKTKPGRSDARQSAGVLLFSHVLDPETGKTPLCAFLQKRGEYDIRRQCPQTWPGVCQVTSEGKLDGKENPVDAILREANEELGGITGIQVATSLLSTDPKQISLYEDGRNHVVGAIVPIETICAIRLEPISGGLVMITEADIPRLVLAKLAWRDEHHDSSDIVVKPHTRKAIINGFKRFSGK